MASVRIDKTIYTTAPSPANRLPKEMAVYAFLADLSVPFSRVDHDPTASIADCEEIDRLLDIEICKNLFLCNSQKTAFYLLMMPGKKPFQTKVLSHQIGSARLSFAPPEYMEAFLNITPGSVSVLGLMNDKDHRVQLLIDRDVLAHPFFGCHPCINTSSLKIATEDLLHKILPATGHVPTVVTL